MRRSNHSAAGSHPADRLLLYPMSRTDFREVNKIDPIKFTEMEKQK